MTEPDKNQTTEARPENLWVNLLFNIVIPAVILTTMSKPERLGPVWALIIGCSLPLGYGIYDLIVRRKWNFFSILGLPLLPLLAILREHGVVPS